MFKIKQEAEQQRQKIQEDSIRERKNVLEDAIMAINQLQDIQSMGIAETEKDKMRNSIINSKRSEWVDKIIELDRLGKRI